MWQKAGAPKLMNDAGAGIILNNIQSVPGFRLVVRHLYASWQIPAYTLEC